jgi:hypothetical protein
MKRNGKLILPTVLGVISLLALSVSLSPLLNMAVKAQGQNQQTSPEMSQQVQQKLVELSQKFRGWLIVRAQTSHYHMVVILQKVCKP